MVSTMHDEKLEHDLAGRLNARGWAIIFGRTALKRAAKEQLSHPATSGSMKGTATKLNKVVV
jgi:hypothetical protein